MADSNSSTPPPAAPPPSTATASSSTSSAPTPTPETAKAAETGSRPVRTAAATANAISEAQSDMKNKSKFGPGGRRKKKDREKIASRISGLDLLHDTTMDCIDGIDFILTFDFLKETQFGRFTFFRYMAIFMVINEIKFWF